MDVHPKVIPSKVSRRRTQVERRAQGEKALLDAAAELFAAQGIVQTSLAQIGQRAGYSRGLVNHHFGTKDALIDRLARQCQEQFWKAFAEIDVETGLEGILATIDTYLAQIVSPAPHGRAFLVMRAAALPEASMAPTIAEADERTREVFVSWIETGHRDGSISRRVKAEPFAAILLGLLHGLAAQLFVAPDAVDMGALRSQCHDVVRAALEEREPRREERQ
ncbi:MAG: TetR/AcrR family transcriptional regulator [Alphaproteobacteria bacterium]|jgi:AcrR family transcriptional regulator|nr:TetR/AcrR family transcriptional regulator [Alphaproteobacteria bacterium]